MQAMRPNALLPLPENKTYTESRNAAQQGYRGLQLLSNYIKSKNVLKVLSRNAYSTWGWSDKESGSKIAPPVIFINNLVLIKHWLPAN